jgi:ribonuclease D
VAEYTRIETRRELEELATLLLGESIVGFDTEADSFYHYFDKTCLLQVATRKQMFLVDPLAMGGPAEMDSLGPVMASPDIRKVFHAAEYDIYVLKRDCGFEFANLFDTMISAQLLGYPAIGLSAIIEHHFHTTLPKDEQRSDWSVRPLTENQLDYAAADVKYLIRLTERLERELRKAKRLDWAHEEFAALTRRAWPIREFDRLGYLKIKGARNLEPDQLAVLRELYLVRDRRAREVDRPPFKVLGNRTVLEIAQNLPDSPDALRNIKGVSDLILRRMGHELMSAVERGRKKGHGPIPKMAGTGRRRLDRRTEQRMNTLKRWRAKRAGELKMDPGVLCPNSALEAVAWKRPASVEDLFEVEELKGWFAREFGAELIAAINSPDEGSRDAAPR